MDLFSMISQWAKPPGRAQQNAEPEESAPGGYDEIIEVFLIG